MNRNDRVTEKFDWSLTLLLFLFFLVSCIAIYSGQASNQYEGTNFLTQQIFCDVVGAIIIAVIVTSTASTKNFLVFIWIRNFIITHFSHFPCYKFYS